jgi:hypothetical protein
MKYSIEATEADPFQATNDGAYDWNGDIHFRLQGCVTTIFNGRHLFEQGSPKGEGGSMLDGEQLIRIMKISAHINSPGKVEKI